MTTPEHPQSAGRGEGLTAWGADESKFTAEELAEGVAIRGEYAWQRIDDCGDGRARWDKVRLPEWSPHA